MDSTIVLWVLAWSGVVSVLIFVLQGILDQLPRLIDSWHRFLYALRGNGNPQNRHTGAVETSTAAGSVEDITDDAVPNADGPPSED